MDTTQIVSISLIGVAGILLVGIVGFLLGSRVRSYIQSRGKDKATVSEESTQGGLPLRQSSGSRPSSCPKCHSKLGSVKSDLHFAISWFKPEEQAEVSSDSGGVELNNIDELIGAMKVLEKLDVETERE
ncbi:MAG: hypothetical protein V3R87_04430 [Dehalococcoidia bacterium]